MELTGLNNLCIPVFLCTLRY